MTKRAESSRVQFKHWLRRATMNLQDYNKLKVTWALVHCLEANEAMQKRVERLMRRDGSEENGEQDNVKRRGLQKPPFKAFMKKDEKRKTANIEAADRAASLLILKRFGKKGLANRNRKDVLELVRVIKVPKFGSAKYSYSPDTGHGIFDRQ